MWQSGYTRKTIILLNSLMYFFSSAFSSLLKSSFNRLSDSIHFDCSLWKDSEGTFWAKVRWYMIPEETAVGRQTHNLRRELYCTTETDKIEVHYEISHLFSHCAFYRCYYVMFHSHLLTFM